MCNQSYIKYKHGFITYGLSLAFLFTLAFLFFFHSCLSIIRKYQFNIFHRTRHTPLIAYSSKLYKSYDNDDDNFPYYIRYHITYYELSCDHHCFVLLVTYKADDDDKGGNDQMVIMGFLQWLHGSQVKSKMIYKHIQLNRMGCVSAFFSLSYLQQNKCYVTAFKHQICICIHAH